MPLSRPLSPSSPLLGQAPKWLKSLRGIGSLRYIVKLIVLACVCISLGWSVTGLFEARGRQDGSLATEAAGLDVLELSDGSLDSTNDEDGGYLNHGSTIYKDRLPEDRPAAAVHNFHSTSMIESVSNKISLWNPWSKAGNSRDSTLDQLLRSGSLQQTEEIVTSARTRTGEAPILGKITIITGGENTVYERALRTHNMHNRIHGYPMHTLRQSILNDVWSKPAYILSIIMRELAKPKAQRLQWLFWVDADTIIINPHVPAEIFLPPRGFEDVHLLVSHDFNGLNNGVFPIRVHSWSVELLAAVLAFPIYKPEEDLIFRDQSAMGELLKMPKFARHAVMAPQRWFNAYQGEINETIAPFQTRPGDLLVHFAGVPNRDERMEYWLRRVDLHLPEWEIEFKHTSYKTETQQFWTDVADTRVRTKDEADKLRIEALDREDLLRKALAKYDTVLNDDEKDRIGKSLEEMGKILEDDDAKENVDAIKVALEKLEDGTISLQNIMNKENKHLLSRAHTLLFAAEKFLFANEDLANITKPQSQLFEAAINHFKETLLMKPIKPGYIDIEMKIVQEKQQEFSRKLEAVTAEAERKVGTDEGVAPAKAGIEEERVEEEEEEAWRKMKEGKGGEEEDEATAATGRADEVAEQEEGNEAAAVVLAPGIVEQKENEDVYEYDATITIPPLFAYSDAEAVSD